MRASTYRYLCWGMYTQVEECLVYPVRRADAFFPISFKNLGVLDCRGESRGSMTAVCSGSSSRRDVRRRQQVQVRAYRRYSHTQPTPLPLSPFPRLFSRFPPAAAAARFRKASGQVPPARRSNHVRVGSSVPTVERILNTPSIGAESRFFGVRRRARAATRCYWVEKIRDRRAASKGRS